MEENMEDDDHKVSELKMCWLRKETNCEQKESEKDQNYDITLIETDFIETKPLDPMENVVDYD